MNPVSFYIGACSATVCILGLLTTMLAFVLYMWRGMFARYVIDTIQNEQTTKALLVPAFTLIFYGAIGTAFAGVLHLVIKAMS